jgi:hypothetical protein
MGSRLFIVLMSPSQNTMALGLFFVLVSLGKKIGSASALSGFPLKFPPAVVTGKKSAALTPCLVFPWGFPPVVDPNTAVDT